MKAGLVGILAGFLLGVGLQAAAFAAAPLVISQIQTGDTASASNEAVELYNNTADDQDITDWCIRYMSASSQLYSSSVRYCFTAPDQLTRVFLSAHAYVSIATAEYAMPHGLVPDGRFTGSGFAGAGGHIRLVGLNDQVIDTVGWGTAQFAEGYVAVLNPAPTAPTSSQALVRKLFLGTVLQDTDNNRTDFESKTPLFRSGGIYEVKQIVDTCGNLAGLQEFVPADYGYDEAGNCELLSADVCLNIDAIQLTPPQGKLSDPLSNCHDDVCSNIEGLQIELPQGFALLAGLCIEQERRPVLITEIFANAGGSDTGHEFIELYNPSDSELSLAGYVVAIGKAFEKTFNLFEHLQVGVLAPRERIVIYDTDLGFTLLNTASGVRIITPAGNVASETSYTEPKDDMSWALFEEGWAYTNQPTPGQDNQPSVVLLGEDESTSSSSLSPCPAGKYRHPITNRCRNIETDTAMLVACNNDEYRNPETNRCRKIATLAASLTPCNDGYERNTSTNRCRKVAAAIDELTPCKEGYERNLETNRCRKLLSAASTGASVIHESDNTGSVLQNTLLITAGLTALGYGAYEWRSELLAQARRLLRFTTGK